MRGINKADEAGFPEEDKVLTLPTRLVVSEKDYATRADVQGMRAKEWLKNPRVETRVCGHWIQLEKRDELFRLLESFVSEIATK